MTSSASQQNQISAPNSSSTAAPSYASAAGATKKPTPTPLTATGANPPLVVGGPTSTVSTPQNGKGVSASPVNGRPNIAPAIPVSAGISGATGSPAVVHGNSGLNGASDNHTRKGSVTINAPSSHIVNGGPVVGSKSGIKFGYDNSPAVAHSTPQTSSSAPIPVPGNSNHRIPSPAHPPSPIPMPSTTGGRPPSSAPPSNPMTFGSFPGDNDRHLKQQPVPQTTLAMGHQQTNTHTRRDSQASAHGEMGNHGAHGPVRGGYQGQSNRGGGRNFTAPYNPQPMGYPPNNQRYTGGASNSRGGMQYPPSRQHFPNSPQPPRASPAPTPAVPHMGTPNMPQTVPVPPNQFYPPGHMYPPQMQLAYGNAAPMNQYPQPMYMPGYGGPQYMNAGPATGAYNSAYMGHPYGQGPTGAQPMSRNSSQLSERPSSSTGHSQPPIIVQTPQQRSSQPTPPAVVQGVSRQPKASKKIVIKTPQGEVVNFSNTIAPSSPAATSHQSRTPPVVASTPTPPPKSFTPLHSRTDSTATNKQLDEKSNVIQKEFMEKVRRSAGALSDNKAKEDEAPAAATADAKAAAEEQAKKEEEVRLNEERLAAEKKAEAEKAKKQAEAEAEAEAKSEAEAKAKAEAEEQAKSKAKADADAQAAAAAKDAEAKAEADKAAQPIVDEDEELERMIREMEEADAKREKEQEELTAKKKAAAEAAKKEAEANKATLAAENDRKLREQEREMERLEEERERQRAEREAKAAGEHGESVTDLLTKKIQDLKLTEPSDAPNSVADKLAKLEINHDSSVSITAPKTGGSDKARTKPAALNLVVPTKAVEPPQPSAALQSLKSARWLDKKELYDSKLYPSGYSSPNPALNSAVTRKNKSFKYDAQFLLQFQKVFTEEPSMEFHQQIKSLIGDSDGGSRSASTRSAGPGTGRSGSKAGPTGGFPSMGQFGSKPLPLGSGTTSAERFAMSQGQIQRPAMGNPMASFGRGGSFPGSHGMSRTPSSTNAGGLPNSPRQGSRRGGGSKRDGFSGGGGGGGQAGNNKNMPLTQGQDVKPITVSASGWKPTSIGNKTAQAPVAVLAQQGHLDPQMVQRKVKAALNKMTPENFDKISDQILIIAGQSKNEQDGRTLRQVIQLTFEKATDEAHWASMYAKFCKRMLEMMSPEIRDESILDKTGNVVSGGALFRKYLLNRCQEEFERGWKVDLPQQPAEGDDKKPGEAALLSDEYYIAAAAKRRGLGLVQFIGELFKLGMLTERIMHECVRKLLEFQGVPDEAEIESLTKLLRTIGANLDNVDKGKAMMDAYFQRIQTIIDLPDLPSRLKFMLMDIVDLRRVHWVSKEANKGPKTLKEIQAEAEAQAAQKAAESARNNQRGAQGGRPPAGRGDARNFSAYNQAMQNQIGSDDLRRLKGSATRTPSTNASFGPTSMFNSRSNSGRRLVPGGGFGRPGEDSGASSRTGTPPTRDSVAHTNAFGLLADSADHPASPPSTNASPALTKASLASEEKKEA